jgi:hypothetical protein
VHITPELTLAQKTLPLAIATALVAAFSLLKEPQRRTCSALVIAGAGATYLAGGLAHGS